MRGRTAGGRWGRVSGAIVVVVVAAATIVGITRADRPAAAVVEVRTGTVWLPNENAGLVYAVNGPSRDVLARASVGEPGADLAVYQHDDGALVLNRDTGNVSRLSERHLGVTQSAVVSAVNQSARLAVGEHALYLVGSAHEPIKQLQPTTLVPAAEEVPIMGDVEALVGEADDLWVADQAQGTVHLVEGTSVATTSQVSDPGDRLHLTLVNGAPVVVNETDASLVPLSRTGEATEARPIRAVEAGRDLLVVTGRPDAPLSSVYAVVAGDGALVVCDVEGACSRSALPPVSPDDQLDVPTYSQSRLYIPNVTQGTVLVVDTATRKVVSAPQVVEAPGQPFELFTVDELVWFNNPGTAEAGIIGPDGVVQRITKYRPDPASDDPFAIPVEAPGGGRSGLGGSDAGPGDGQGPGTRGVGPDDDPATSTAVTAPAAPPAEATAQADGGSGGVMDEPEVAGRDGAVVETGTGGDEVGPTSPDATEGSPTRPDDDGEAVEPTDALTAAFFPGPARVGRGQEVQFEDRSTGRPTSWAWDFGDGTTSDERHPRKTWERLGRFPVLLRVRDDEGRSSVQEHIVEVVDGRPVEARIGIDRTTVEVDEPVRLVDRSTGGSTSWSWDLGDGVRRTEREVEHHWSTPGRKTVTLEVSNGSDTQRATVSVTVVPRPSQAPRASFTGPTQAVVGEEVTFQDTSANEPTVWSWDFGDGSSGSSARRPTHRFMRVGTFTVELTASNSAGGHTATSEVVVTQARGTGRFEVLGSPPATAAFPGGYLLEVETQVGPVVEVNKQSSDATCRMSLQSGQVSRAQLDFVGAGSCVVVISQPSSADLDGAPARTISIEVRAPAPPTSSGTLVRYPTSEPLSSPVQVPACSFTSIDWQVNNPPPDHEWGDIQVAFDTGDGQAGGTFQPGIAIEPVYTAPGSYQFTAVGKHVDGYDISTTNSPVTMEVGPPDIDLRAPSTASTGEPVTIEVSPIFGFCGDKLTGTWTIDFGDGTPVYTRHNAFQAVTVDHVYVAASTRTITATFTTDQGPATTKSLPITVRANTCSVVSSVTSTLAYTPPQPIDWYWVDESCVEHFYGTHDRAFNQYTFVGHRFRAKVAGGSTVVDEVVASVPAPHPCARSFGDRTNLQVINQTAEPIYFYWFRPDCTEWLVGEVQPGQRGTTIANINYVYRVRRSDGTLIKEFTVTAPDHVEVVT